MSKVSEYAWKDKKMRFIKNVIKEDLVHEFSQVSIDFSENGEEMFAVFRNESGSELLLHFGDRFTLSFDKWHGDYMFTNDCAKDDMMETPDFWREKITKWMEKQNAAN